MYAKGAKMTAEDKHYMAEEDCRTLMNAKEIQADKPRYKKAMEYAKMKYEALAKVMEEKNG